MTVDTLTTGDLYDDVESLPDRVLPAARSPSLTDDEAESTATLFKALADPARVKIINLLTRSDGAVCACDFEAALQLSQPTVSHHLRKLTDAGLLQREQRGKWAYFSINPDAAGQLAAVADLPKGVAPC